MNTLLIIGYVLVALFAWPIFYRRMYLWETGGKENWSRNDRTVGVLITTWVSVFWFVFLPLGILGLLARAATQRFSHFLDRLER